LICLGAVLPLAKVADVSISSQLCCPCLCRLHNTGIQPDRKEHFALLSALLLEGGVHLVSNPFTANAILRKQQQQLIMQVNSLVNALAYPIPNFHILWCKPAPDTFRLQVGMQSMSKHFILIGVRDEARIILNGMHHPCSVVVNPLIRHTDPA